MTTQPEFPEFIQSGGSWESQVRLPSWTESQARSGPYGSEVPGHAIDQRAYLVSLTRAQGLRPSEAQRRAVEFLIDHELEVRTQALKAVLKHYRRARPLFASIRPAFRAVMPPAKRVEDLQQLVGLSCIHVHETVLDGTAYLGLELGCTWDEEHGIGVLLHRLRVVDVGSAESSFLEWIAEEDAEKTDLPS